MPESGARNPETTPNSVDFPAPFGPISAVMPPAATARHADERHAVGDEAHPRNVAGEIARELAQRLQHGGPEQRAEHRT